MQPALNGLKVLDFTRVLSGPYATMILGDLGAEIIKVESPQGDESRSWPPILKGGESAYFMALNRNKKSITLNLKTDQGRGVAQQLAARADVVMENFTPGVAQKLGIGFDTLHALNPDLIYCSISGFGQTGPYRNKKAYDPIVQGMTGLMSITGERGRTPVKVGIPITDLAAANNAVTAVLAAYIHRLKGGGGQYIDISLYDGMVAMLTVMAMDYFVAGKAPEKWGLDHIHRVPARAFLARDGRYVQVAATSDGMYSKFCKIIGLEELIADPRFATNTLRVKNRDKIAPLLEKKLLEKDCGDWLQRFEQAGIPCGPILNIEEVFADPNVRERKLMFTMPHPVEGEVRQLGFPFNMSATPPQARLRPPLLGEHSQSILMDFLGYSADRIQEIRDAGAM